MAKPKPTPISARVAALQQGIAKAAAKPGKSALEKLADIETEKRKAAKAAAGGKSRLPPFSGGKKAPPMPPASENEPAPRKKAPPGLKMPKALGAVADLLYTTRNARLALSKEETKLELEEKFIKNHIIDTLPKSLLGGVAGKLCRVSIETAEVPQVESWSKVYAHIVATYLDHVKRKTGQQDGAFALLNRTVNAATVNDVWAEKKEVPGVKAFKVVKVGINKL